MKDVDIELLDDDIEIIDDEIETVDVETKIQTSGNSTLLQRREKRRKVNVYVTKNKINNKIGNKIDNKKKFRFGEKVFVCVNILIILGLIAFYAYRTYYYYHLTHDIKENVHLVDKLTSLSNIAFQDDGLYEKSGYFYYKGEDVSNYVYYSGRLFRIIDIKDGIRMIEDETETNLVWSIDSDFKDSNINIWLNKYLETLKDYDVFLKKNNWCNDKINIEDYNCANTIEQYVGLLSTNDYLQAGGKNSYLNNKTYFWTINQDENKNVFYVNSDGSINNILRKDNNYYSYGIRPVITLKEDVSIISGDGTKNSPFIIENLGNALLKDNSVGSHVKFHGENYRILNISENGVSLISENLIELPKKYINVNDYLNGEYLKNFNKDELVKITYTIDEYSYNNSYRLESTNAKKESYITIPKIGDLFLNELNNYWLNNYSDDKLGLYYIIDENKMFFSDLKNNEHYIRPVITLNVETVVTGGTGISSDPLIIGEEGETNVE